MVIGTIFLEAGQIDPFAVLQPLVDKLEPLLIKMGFIFGGIFGIYLILLASKVYFERKKVEILKDIRFDLDQLNKHYGLPYSVHKKGWWKQLVEGVRHNFEMRKAHKYFQKSNKSKK
jgi:hypothetical protein